MPDREPEESIYRRALDLVATAVARRGVMTLIAVDGRSGSGKTTLARRLGSDLGAPVLALDDLYQGWDGLLGAVTILERTLLPTLERGATAHWPRWDWARQVVDGENVLDPAPRVILEGCGASALSLSSWVTRTIWCEASEVLRRTRLAARGDWPYYAPHFDRWAAQENALFDVEKPWDRADLVIHEG